MVADDDQLLAHARMMCDAAERIASEWGLDQGDLMEVEDMDVESFLVGASDRSTFIRKPALYVGTRDGVPMMLVDGELRVLQGVVDVLRRVNNAVG